MDERFREAERAWHAEGTPEAEGRFRRECARFGLHFRDHKREEILTEWEEIQADYDDLWWHASTPHKCGLWNHSCFRHRDEDFKTSIFKAHHDWGHRGWDTKNSKRKTLRTHRNPKKKARNYRLPKERKPRSPETPHEKRRKKRFAGRERLYGREWVWDPEVQWYRIYVWVRIPSDE